MKSLFGMFAARARGAGDILKQLGLTKGLKLCLDAGDAGSYTSGRTWKDRSGGGCDFGLGKGPGAGPGDPKFSGGPGKLSKDQYFAFDGEALFTLPANAPWMQNLHKAGAKLTLMAWLLPRLDKTGAAICGTKGTGPAAGFRWGWSEQGAQQVHVGNGKGNTVLAGPTLADGAWQFAAISIDEAVGANGAVLALNGAQTRAKSTYDAPVAGPAVAKFQIGASASTAFLRPNSRLAMFIAHEGVALKPKQLDAFFGATRARFGI